MKDVLLLVYTIQELDADCIICLGTINIQKIRRSWPRLDWNFVRKILKILNLGSSSCIDQLWSFRWQNRCYC